MTTPQPTTNAPTHDGRRPVRRICQRLVKSAHIGRTRSWWRRPAVRLPGPPRGDQQVFPLHRPGVGAGVPGRLDDCPVERVLAGRVVGDVITLTSASRLPVSPGTREP